MAVGDTPAGNTMCCNFCKLQLNARAGSGARSSLGKGCAGAQRLLQRGGELGQGGCSE